ncbi:MAG: 30S ribosomal protein S15 [Chloroflexi bacterium CG07_land_8_20_14_0_80_45_17]|nr:MAG: 30S ribosomal protein S15 [Chloroflexi bacterium CG23_combo_of_CG06-09_8_20_14_all_45_10]PIU56576.1 MAG: 30S ribosomal protein S15 [Chloroflexi bacterium CG07_land_8_20_14_0_80_45_17]
MLEKEKKGDTITQFRLSEDDTGSVEVQVALLTERVSQLMEHLKVHSHDHHSRRALLKLIGQRRRFLSYLNRTYPDRYYSLTTRLGLRK